MNAFHAHGPKHGFKGISLEASMRLFNNYFKVYDDINIMEMADEVGLEPWELGQILIKISIHLYKEMGKEQILSLEETPTELVKEYVEDMIIKESE